MAGIFISYRRDESRHAAGRLADDLADAFGPESIFRDIEGIEPGVDFTQALDKALQTCVVMLVLIGPRWLQIEDGEGRRRLDQPGDWIRQEVATALARQTRVIPVLLEGAALPSEADLPEDLRPLVRRQAFELADGRWRGDLQRLVQVLSRVPGLDLRRPQPAPPPPAPAPVPAPAPAPQRAGNVKPMMIGAAIGVTALIAVALWADGSPEPPPDDSGPSGPVVIDEPPAVPGPGPSPAPEPARATAPPVPDLSGLWRTHTGEVYHFDQDGRDVDFTAEAAGQAIGDGRGRVDGGILRLSMTMRVDGVVMGLANCDMQLAPDARSMTGMCNGPNGPFPAQIFR